MTLETIPDHQRHALQNPLRIDAAGGRFGLPVMRFPTTKKGAAGPCIDVVLTVDVDYPEGPAWHALLSHDRIDRDFYPTPDVAPFSPGPVWLLIIAKLIGGVGAGDVDCMLSRNGRQAHAFRALSAEERAIIAEHSARN